MSQKSEFFSTSFMMFILVIIPKYLQTPPSYYENENKVAFLHWFKSFFRGHVTFTNLLSKNAKPIINKYHISFWLWNVLCNFKTRPFNLLPSPSCILVHILQSCPCLFPLWYDCSLFSWRQTETFHSNSISFLLLVWWMEWKGKHLLLNSNLCHWETSTLKIN